jgi:hypothetical protein
MSDCQALCLTPEELSKKVQRVFRSRRNGSSYADVAARHNSRVSGTSRLINADRVRSWETATPTAEYLSEAAIAYQWHWSRPFQIATETFLDDWQERKLDFGLLLIRAIHGPKQGSVIKWRSGGTETKFKKTLQEIIRPRLKAFALNPTVTNLTRIFVRKKGH